MIKTYKFKLYNSKKNKHLHRNIDVSASIYNHCIALHKRYYKLSGVSLNKYRLQKHLTKLKKLEKLQYWKQVPSQSIQDITDRIDRAYRLFFKSLKTSRFVAPPSFRKRIKYKSFTLKQAGYSLLEENKIKIGKKIYKFYKSRDLSGVIKTLTVKRDSLGDIYLYFSCELANPKPSETQCKTSVGMDFGLKTFLTLSNGEKIDSPQFFKQGLNAIRKANKNLSSKKKGSSNRRKARLNLARIHKKVGNQRKDFHFKLAKKLTDQYDIIFHEDLNINAMKRLWGRKVSDLGFSEYIKIQNHIAIKVGHSIYAIDRFFPSSKMCHSCKFINHDLELKDRSWTCPSCNAFHDRDDNASINIHSEGATSLRLGNVRPPSKVAISA